MDRHHGTLQWLDDQIALCDQRSESARERFKRLQIVQLATAFAIPAIALLSARRRLIAALGALNGVVEAAQYVSQYQQKWISYRGACEALKQEKFLFLERAGPYEAAADARGLLAERVEDLVFADRETFVRTRRGIDDNR